MKQLFVETPQILGQGQVISKWDPHNKYLAAVGTNYRVRIYARNGSVLNEFALLSKHDVLDIDWDRDGDTFAVAQQQQNMVLIYDVATHKVSKLNTDLKKLTFLAWNRGSSSSTDSANDNGNLLSIGCSKGNLLLYNKLTLRKQLVMGKHSKKILYGAWNSGNQLALVAKDKVLTISDIDGNTVSQNVLKQTPTDLQFGSQMCDHKKSELRTQSSAEEDTVSMCMNGRTLYLCFVHHAQPIELAFQPKYGDITCYRWYGDGYICAGFSKGFVICISTHEKEMGEEIHSLRIDYRPVFDICVRGQYAAIATVRGIKLVDVSSFKENASLFVPWSVDHGTPSRLSWSSDGQLLTVNSSNGYLASYLMKTDESLRHVQIFDNRNLCFLSSLQQITVLENYLSAQKKLYTIQLSIEPRLVAVGSAHCCVSFNNHLWCYSFEQSALRFEYDFIAEIQDMAMNASHVAALVDQKIYLIKLADASGANAIRPHDHEDIQPFVMAAKSDDSIVCFSLTPLFLVCASANGVVYQTYLENYKAVNETKHNIADGTVSVAANEDDTSTANNSNSNRLIRSVHPNHNGTLTVFIDSCNHGYLYNPVIDTKLKIDKFSTAISCIYWDKGNQHIFYGYDATKRIMRSFVYHPQTIRGPSIEPVDSTALDKAMLILAVDNGVVIGYNSEMDDHIEYKLINAFDALYEAYQQQQPMPSSSSQRLHHHHHSLQRQPPPSATPPMFPTHDGFNKVHLNSGATNKKTESCLPEIHHLLSANFARCAASRKCFYQLVNLHFLQSAYFVSLRLNQRDVWTALSKKCLELLEINLAISVFRSLQNAASVLLLDKLRNEHDLFLVSGHCCSLLNDFEMAQKLFLLSRKPVEALKMRLNLLQFDKALQLAETLDRSALPKICFDFAKQLEFKQSYKDALKLYERAKSENENSQTTSAKDALEQSCLAGIIRCTLRNGYIQKGVSLAVATHNKTLQYECANLLQCMEQYHEAGQLFVKCEQITKAVHCFIQCKNFDDIKPLIHRVSTPSLHVKFAKEMEQIENYVDALKSYEIANDRCSIIRLYLYHLNEAEKAIALVRANPFAEGAKLVAQFTLSKRDMATCIEFLVLAKSFEKAFEISKTYNHIDVYCRFLEQTHHFQQFKAVAEYYLSATQKHFANAAKCYLKASMFEEALLNFIHAGMNENLEHILHIIRECNDDQTIVDMITEHMHELQNGKENNNNNNSNNNSETQPGMDNVTLFRLYLAIGEIQMATKMSIEISEQQQRMGHYQKAHQILFEMIRELMQRTRNKQLVMINNSTNVIAVQEQLRNNLLLVHSYLLVKSLIKKNENYLAAQMLIRVCESISKFPSHIVQILTSTVIQCQKTGFYAQAIQHANYLMRPEYRKQIIPKYKKKIESIVRHSYKEKDERQSDRELHTEMSPCPYCKVSMPSTDLYCKSCKNIIPYCILTGQHMVLADWSCCPRCTFPALYSYFVQHVGKHEIAHCPMCHEEVHANEIVLDSNPTL